MKKLILFVFFSPFFINAQEVELHAVNVTIPFEEGRIVRTVQFYQSGSDTLVESLYLIDYDSPDKPDETNAANKTPYQAFIQSEKDVITQFVGRKIRYALGDGYTYSYEVDFPNLYRVSVMNSSFRLMLEHEGGLHMLQFDILDSTGEIKKQVDAKLKN